MFVIGTAGHIDHGKSVLIQRLTGIDPDRLREEKERGMTIDLGFAWLKLPSGNEVGIIDVPGHERFIKNMLAGVGSIDLALVVVAANEGVMPQTKEHLAILDLLQVERGIVVITKKDLVDDELLSLVRMEVEDIITPTTLAGAPIIAVSAVSGDGLDELIATIDGLLSSTEPREDTGRPRLLIDRSFTISGAGTVVTGTLIDGSLSQGEDVEIVPSGIKARIRGLQTHKTRLDSVHPGSRVAANLVGVSTDKLERGDVLTKPGWLKPTTRVDVRLKLLDDVTRPLRHGGVVSFFVGAAEALGKVHLLEGEKLEPGDRTWAQFSLDKPVAVVKNDHFIIRSPNDTLGGGTIVSSHARRHRRFRPDIIQNLEAMYNGTAQEMILAVLELKQPLELGYIIVQCNLTGSDAQNAVNELIGQNKVIKLTGQGEHTMLYTDSAWGRLQVKAETVVKEYHKKFPTRQGMPRSELNSKLGVPPHSPVMEKLYNDNILREVGTFVRLPSYQLRLTGEQQVKIDAFLRSLQQNPYSPPGDVTVDPDLLALLIEQQKVVRVADGVVFSKQAYDEMVVKIISHAKQQGSITLAEVRDLFSTSRKYAKALLEYMDEKKLTKRVGDIRVVK
jgi:selenocysteine-specific elongation factor